MTFVTPSRREGPPSIWDTHGISGNVFANPDASSSAPYPQELHQWNSSLEEPLHSSTVEKRERQKQDQDLRCQSGPSAKNSVIFSGGDSPKNYGADQQRLQISDLPHRFSQAVHWTTDCIPTITAQDKSDLLDMNIHGMLWVMVKDIRTSPR